VAAYTQAIMDLGSTVCTRAHPACDACPVNDGCVARATGRQATLPSPRPRRSRPHREAIALLLVRSDGAVLLEDRPPEGLWGGLASLMMFESDAEALSWCEEHVGPVGSGRALPAYEHAFTHFDLTLHPIVVCAEASGEIEGHRWFDPAHPQRIGLSKPAVDLMRAVTPPFPCEAAASKG
jgi:A/G-specific adenine glycosylase